MPCGRPPRGRWPWPTPSPRRRRRPPPSSPPSAAWRTHDRPSVSRPHLLGREEGACPPVRAPEVAARHRMAAGDGAVAMTADVFIADGVRTPIGRFGGALAGVRPDDLAATVLAALVARHDG